MVVMRGAYLSSLSLFFTPHHSQMHTPHLYSMSHSLSPSPSNNFLVFVSYEHHTASLHPSPLFYISHTTFYILHIPSHLMHPPLPPSSFLLPPSSFLLLLLPPPSSLLPPPSSLLPPPSLPLFDSSIVPLRSQWE